MKAINLILTHAQASRLKLFLITAARAARRRAELLPPDHPLAESERAEFAALLDLYSVVAEATPPLHPLARRVQTAAREALT